MTRDSSPAAAAARGAGGVLRLQEGGQGPLHGLPIRAVGEGHILPAEGGQQEGGIRLGQGGAIRQDGAEGFGGEGGAEKRHIPAGGEKGMAMLQIAQKGVSQGGRFGRQDAEQRQGGDLLGHAAAKSRKDRG